MTRGHRGAIEREAGDAVVAQLGRQLVDGAEGLRVAPRALAIRARTAEGAEREELWRLMNRSWPNYDTYATRTDREIPVVVLERR